MKGFLAAALAGFLPRDEYEAALGDLAEANENPRQVVLELLGLVVRRQIAPWRNWQPWLAAFGLALPGSFLLMGASFSVVLALQRTQWGMTMERGLILDLMASSFLLIAWSWAAGFVASALSRRTLWTSGVAGLVPCVLCVTRFENESLSRFSLFLFVVPAVLGVWQGIHAARISRRVAMLGAAMATGLALFGRKGGFFWPDAALLWPIWYVVATASGNMMDRENGETA